MVQAPRDLEDLARKGGTIQAECRNPACGRVALFAPGDLLTYFRRKGFDCSWPHFASHLVCRRPDGCGQRGPFVRWLVNDPPPRDDFEPPRPRFTRSPLPKAPEPIDFEAYRKRRAG